MKKTGPSWPKNCHHHRPWEQKQDDHRLKCFASPLARRASASCSAFSLTSASRTLFQPNISLSAMAIITLLTTSGSCRDWDAKGCADAIEVTGADVLIGPGLNRGRAVGLPSCRGATSTEISIASSSFHRSTRRPSGLKPILAKLSWMSALCIRFATSGSASPCFRLAIVTHTIQNLFLDPKLLLSDMWLRHTVFVCRYQWQMTPNHDSVTVTVT